MTKTSKTQTPTTAESIAQIARQAQIADQLPLLASRADRLARRIADRLNQTR